MKGIYADGELRPEATIRKFRIVRPEGEQPEEATCKVYLQVRQEGARAIRRRVRYYRLEIVLAVGFRVRSHRGVQFRIWATQRLREYIVKGFALDDERLKRGGGGNYFDELLARIRDIRIGCFRVLGVEHRHIQCQQITGRRLCLS